MMRTYIQIHDPSADDVEVNSFIHEGERLYSIHLDGFTVAIYGTDVVLANLLTAAIEKLGKRAGEDRLREGGRTAAHVFKDVLDSHGINVDGKVT